jgi:hypothetical protein
VPGVVSSTRAPYAPQRLHRHRQVRGARQRPALVPHGHALLEARRRQQQPADQLGGLRGVERDAPAAEPARTAHDERERLHVVQLRAELPQRRQQRPERTLPYPRVAVEAHLALRQRGERRQEPRDRARVADVEVADARLQRPGDAVDQPVAVRRVRHLDAQAAQGGRHQLGVAGAQRAAHGRAPVGERGEDERPVGDRLGARQRDDGIQRTRCARGGPGVGRHPLSLALRAVPLSGCGRAAGRSRLPWVMCRTPARSCSACCCS